jgi:hypothetical protein
MSQINPFTGSVLQAPQVQQQQASDKDRQLRRAVDQQKNAALQGDRLEHQVESSEELAEIHDQDTPDPRKRKKQPSPGQKDDQASDDAGEAHLDVTG